MSFLCNYCNNNFSTLSSLTKHKKSSKYCLKIQNKKILYLDSDYKCEYCKNTFTTKQRLLYHLNICKEQKMIFFKKKNKNLVESIIFLKKEIEEQKIIIYHLSFLVIFSCIKKLKFSTT